MPGYSRLSCRLHWLWLWLWLSGLSRDRTGRLKYRTRRRRYSRLGWASGVSTAGHLLNQVLLSLIGVSTGLRPLRGTAGLRLRWRRRRRWELAIAVRDRLPRWRGGWHRNHLGQRYLY